MPFKVLNPEQAKEAESAMAKPDQSQSWMNKPVTINYAGESDVSADIPLAGAIKISGPNKTKYSEAATKSAKFAIRMQTELEVLKRLESSGFTPINFRDQLTVLTPFLRQPGAINNAAKSGKYQIYENAVKNFVMAGLRDESGAAIPTPEIIAAMPLYMPVFGDSIENIREKQQRRENVLNAMISASGGAYEEFKENLDKSQAADDASAAMREQSSLESQAKSDPALRARIEAYKLELRLQSEDRTKEQGLGY
jgi:hypothetical protein